MPNDFYTILSLPRDVKPAQIKDRFRELARERHPDRFQGEDKDRAEIAFQNITEAFNVLMNPLLRRQHDLELDRPTAKPVHDPQEGARVYMSRGVRAYKKGNYPEAADYFSRATESGSKPYQAWHHLALTCLKKERWLPRAQEAIVKACTLRPGHVPYLKLAGKIFAHSGMTARAIQYYNKALREGGPDLAVNKALKALQGAHGRDPQKGKPGPFGKTR